MEFFYLHLSGGAPNIFSTVKIIKPGQMFYGNRQTAHTSSQAGSGTYCIAVPHKVGNRRI